MTEVVCRIDLADIYSDFVMTGERIVRCKDCKNNSGTVHNVFCDLNYGSWMPEDFCSHGERRE